MKQLWFISTGRCGTKRIAEILDEHLPGDAFAVQHQMDISRLSNVLGNVMYYTGSWEWLKKRLYRHVIRKYAKEKPFICSDPLISMIIPREALSDPDIHIVHIVRDREEFAGSFFRFTRKRFLSFFAHNFVPFWQIGVLPLENILNPRIREKYKRVWQIKNDWLRDSYESSPNYRRLSMEEIFSGDRLSRLIREVFEYPLEVTEDQLRIRSNQTAS